jgi:hypothetical protein
VVQYSLTRRFQTTADGLVGFFFGFQLFLASFSCSAYLTVFLSLLQEQVQRFIKRQIPFSPKIEVREK